MGMCISKSCVAVAAVLASSLVVIDQADAAPNLILGIPSSAETNFTDFGSNDPDNFTDANLGTADYGLYFNGGSSFQPTVDFVLASSIEVSRVGMTANDPSRRVAKFVDLEFYSDNTFTILVGTRNVPFLDQDVNLVDFIGVQALAVRFLFPFGTSGYYPTRSDVFYTRINELELYSIPEPASLGLIGIGAVCTLARRRRKAC